MTMLQLYWLDPLVELGMIFMVSVLGIAIGTYVGTLLALRKFFGELYWEDVFNPDQD
ncbi:hypothetical protein [Halococcoides cellulosivorans]|uniref:hypothetical protein n=1 Tax=Halococcoides cellulosivorans TaxID=1679096 RepID=UPI00131F297C|nr:hypothetical protein [Halococcoides cellulosivorans]